MSLESGQSTPITLGDLREQFRIQRHQEFLRTALRIVTTEGIGALTMQRLADELECAVGSIYRYFPSKTALMAELQRESLEVLQGSLLLMQSHLDDLIADRSLDHRPAAMARVVGAIRFWIGAEDTFPREIEMSRRLFTDPTVRFSDEDGIRVLPAAFRPLDLARRLFDEAVAAGALNPGPSMERALVVVAGTNGVLMLSGLARWDQTLFQGRRLALDMVRAVLIGWGAEPNDLDRADELVAELAEHGRLVPSVPEPEADGG